MKIVVINFSGNVGKSTVVRHMLAPRMPNAAVRSVESINANDLAAEKDAILRGQDFGELYAWLMSVDDALVDVGTSNVEDFIKLMADYEGSHDVFDLYVVPTMPEAKQQIDTRKTIDKLESFGVDPERIRLLFNIVDKGQTLEKTFSSLFDYYKRERSFVLNEGAILYKSPAYAAAATAGVTVGELAASRDAYKECLAGSGTTEDRQKWAQLVAQAAIAVGASAQLDRAYSALLS